ncbi:helix-turn-helix transcriptional regulator [Nocardioides aquiterrae]|uniref:HTH luxR-type domain-containing protein n=1 Tax=Nocardioides aquiterrae TaxID=203799 RepID=A0ABN1UNG0_9ACTN
MTDERPDVRRAPRQLLTPGAKQRVLDASARLQVRRSEVAATLVRGPVADAEIVAAGSTNPELYQSLWGHSDSWREMHSIRSSATVEQLRVSLPNNRRLLERGMRMESVFDAGGLGVGALLLLANESAADYLVSFAPLEMKIIDRRYVMLQGPTLPDGVETVMAVRSPACLEAAWRYWEVVREHAVPAAEWAGTSVDLTRRQRQVVALMSTGLGDDAIADTLGVSVRTVRADIAALLDLLGVRTRFAAGVRLQLWPDADR